MSGPDDADLARAVAAGDRAALAAIYDRYADRLFDFSVGMLRDRDAAADCVQDVFVTAATKIGQLREADKLRPWLYAIARSECLARIRARTREQPTEELPDMPSSTDGPDDVAARSDLVDLVRAASAGLSERDQTVLELSYRQGLAGPELADALGVTPRNANTLVERLRDTFGRSLGALLIARQGRADPNRCPELAALLADWDDVFTVLMRKRIARHIDDCAVCDEAKSRMVSPAALLATAPVLVPAPAWLRGRTLDHAVVALPRSGPTDGSWWPEPDFDDPTGPVSRGDMRRIGVGAAIAALAIGGAVLLATQPTRVVPTDSPSSSTTTSAATTSSRGFRRTATPSPPPPPPASMTTTTTFVPPPTAIPRTQEPAPAPAPVPPPPTTTAPFTRHTPPPTTAEPAPPPPHTPHTKQPTPEPEPDDQQPPKTPPSTTKKPSVPTVNQPPPAQNSPDQQCTPATPCPTGPPVFS